MGENNEKFDSQVAMVEVMGHKRLFGYITEEEHGGTMMIRVDTKDFTQYLTAQAIFSITPITDTLYMNALEASEKPIKEHDLPEYYDMRNKIDSLKDVVRQYKKELPDFEPRVTDYNEIPY